jgi:hypothetical protein
MDTDQIPITGPPVAGSGTGTPGCLPAEYKLSSGVVFREGGAMTPHSVDFTGHGIHPNAYAANNRMRPANSSRRPLRAWSGALLIFGSLALAGGCGMSDGPGALFVDPGRYSFYHCDNLAAEQKEQIKRENELAGLMEKADESPGGAVIGSFAYRSDYDTVLAQEKLLHHEAVEKQCSFASPAQSQSDQAIR